MKIPPRKPPSKPILPVKAAGARHVSAAAPPMTGEASARDDPPQAMRALAPFDDPPLPEQPLPEPDPEPDPVLGPNMRQVRNITLGVSRRLNRLDLEDGLSRTTPLSAPGSLGGGDLNGTSATSIMFGQSGTNGSAMGQPVAAGSPPISITGQNPPVSVPPANTPVNTVLPVISGSLAHGSVLTVTDGTWASDPTALHYQWSLNGKPQIKTDANHFTTTAGMVGSTIGCAVTASNSLGAGQATAAPVGPIT